jgi:hypothetical protein
MKTGAPTFGMDKEKLKMKHKRNKHSFDFKNSKYSKKELFLPRLDFQLFLYSGFTIMDCMMELNAIEYSVNLSKTVVYGVLEILLEI